ncbi:MAG: glycosyltransferase family 4 protein [Pyrinomonadaceae bacterium]
MTPIKVLHVLEVEKEAFYFNNLVDLSAHGELEHSFVTFAGEGRFTESMRERGCRVIALDARTKRSLLAAAARLRRIIRDERPDLIHTHLFNPTVIGLIVARLEKKPALVTRHHSDAIHLIQNRLKRSFYLLLERLNNRLATHIVAPSRMVRQCLVEWENVPEWKVSLIPYGQRMSRFEAVTQECVDAKRKELGMNEQLSLVCISRLFHRKGHKFLFKALAPLIASGLNARLYLVGEGDYRPTLEKLAGELGIADNVTFLGWRDDILEIIGSADIVVHPSLEDALSQSLIESIMLAKPVIATDISGASDTLGDGKYGRLVPPADSDAFREAVEDTIADIAAARERAEKGREYLLEYMDAGRTTAEYVRLYRRLLAD